MQKTFVKTLAALTLLPLMACGQTPVSNAAQTPATAQKPAQGNVAENLKARLEKAYEAQDLKVLSVGETPIQGLYEVVISGKQIIYTDAQGNYMIVGDLIDINSRKSLTDMRAADLNKIDFASLPLDKAIKEVRGSGKLQVASSRIPTARSANVWNTNSKK